MERVLIAGGSGFIGQKLTAVLQHQGYAVGWLSRSAGKRTDVTHFQWDVDRQTIDPGALAWADHLVVLAGAGIADQRWTKSRKKLIISSRVNSAHTLQKAMKATGHRIQTVTAASAVGFYGNRGDMWLNEESAPSDGFLSYSTQEWEKANLGFREVGIEPAIIRIGLVLGKESGLLKEMDKQLRWGIRPIVGNGKQYYPWIHLDDVCGIFAHALKNKWMGTFNGVAPHPVTQNELLKKMVKARGTIALPAPAPAFVLRLMLGEMASAVLSGQKVSADKVQSNGYEFTFPQLTEALADLYST